VKRHKRIVILRSNWRETVSRNKNLLEIGNELAINVFTSNCQKCKTDDELAGFVRMLCVLSSKMIHGMDGEEFKNNFLSQAMADTQRIEPKRVQ
jgi:hypothetical protein